VLILSRGKLDTPAKKYVYQHIRVRIRRFGFVRKRLRNIPQAWASGDDGI